MTSPTGKNLEKKETKEKKSEQKRALMRGNVKVGE